MTVDGPWRRYPRNRTGRDFVVGDVHGMFSALRELLAVAGFDDRRDRLFSVGDLIDRGPDSRGSLDWLSGVSRRFAGSFSCPAAGAPEAVRRAADLGRDTGATRRRPVSTRPWAAQRVPGRA